MTVLILVKKPLIFNIRVGTRYCTNTDAPGTSLEKDMLLLNM